MKKKRISRKKIKKIKKIKQKKQLKKLNLVIIFTLSTIALVLAFLFFEYLNAPEKYLGVGANIEEAHLNENNEIVYIKLAGGTLEKNITKIKFIFADKQGKEYFYETSEGAQEISMPFKRSFLKWLFGRPAFEGKYDYEINANEINLENFENLKEVSVIFEYKTETNQTIITPPLDVEKPTTQNKTTTKPTPSSSGPSGPSGPSTPPCTPNKDCSYYYGLSQCGSGLDNGCSYSLECFTCSSGYICQNGSCVVDVACYNDSDCNADGWYNVSRIVDEQCKEKNQTKQENRNYSCNLTSSSCQYEIINETVWGNIGEVNKTNGIACNDSLFCAINDACYGGICSGQARVCPDDSIDCTIPFCNEANDECGLNVGGCECSPSSPCPDDRNVCTDEACISFSCQIINNTASCNDGLFCTINDACSLGVCTGQARVCPSDGIACTEDVCNEVVDSCQHIANDSRCSVGEVCDVLAGCSIINLCAGIISCSNYPDATNCTNDPCNIGDCGWDSISGNCGECLGTDGACGIYPVCNNCNWGDNCDANEYKDYYCENNIVGCNFTSHSCSDCSCNCGNYNQTESLANGNCNDGKDNDCDGAIDNADSGCIGFPTDYVSYWKFETANFIITPDETGRNNGILMGNAKIVNDTEKGNVLSLDGFFDYVNCGNDNSLAPSNEITISAWIKPKEVAQQNRFVVSKMNSYFLDAMRSWDQGDYPHFYVYNSGGGYGYTSSYPTKLTANQWTHLVGTYDNTTIKVYINGVQAGSTVFTARIGTSMFDVYIGADSWAMVSSSFNGSIDDVMIFNRSLSENEIQQIYNAQKPGEMPTLSPFAKLWNWLKNLFKIR